LAPATGRGAPFKGAQDAPLVFSSPAPERSPIGTSLIADVSTALAGKGTSAISASATRGESRRQATDRSADSVLIARTSEFLLAGKLRLPDALFGDLHALDALEAEEQFDEVRRRLGGDPLHDRPERLLHVLAEGDALDREAAQVHFHALVRLKHARAFAR